MRARHRLILATERAVPCCGARDSSQGCPKGRRACLPRDDTRKVAAKGLSVAQYRYEWIRRHPDFEKEFESLLLTNAVMAEELHEKQDEGDPQASKFVAALAETTAVLDAYKQRGGRTSSRATPSPSLSIPIQPKRNGLRFIDATKSAASSNSNATDSFLPLRSPTRNPRSDFIKMNSPFGYKCLIVTKELKNFTQVGQRLGHTESNVRRAYDKVFFDIFGAPQP
jgi:hypothetical protein